MTPSIAQPISPSADQPRIRGVDLLRTMAVAFVIMSHAGARGFAGFGVPFLIVLSSFLVSRIYLGVSVPETFRAHFLRRFLRIAPAYYSYLIFTLAVDWLLSSKWSLLEVLTAVFHTVNVVNAYAGHSHPIAHVWTLSILEQFYLLSFLLLPLLLRLTKQRLLLVTCVTVVVVSATRLVLYLRMPEADHLIYNSLLLRADMFMFGLLLSRYYSTIVRLADSVAVSAVSFCLAAAAILLSGASPVFHYSAGFAVEAAAAAIMIVSLHGLSVSGILENRALTRIAAFSYSAYLFQMWSLGVAEEVTQAPLLKGLIGVLISFACGAVVHQVVETPFLKLRSRLIRRAVASEGANAA